MLGRQMTFMNVRMGYELPGHARKAWKMQITAVMWQSTCFQDCCPDDDLLARVQRARNQTDGAK